MIPFHPVTSEMPRGAGRDAIRADILAHGQRVPIVLVDGMIWDGRMRAEICEEIGRSPWLVPLRRKSPMEYYIYSNYERAGAPNSSERTALTTAISAIFASSHEAQMLARREEWLRAARAEFKRLERSAPEPCAVCGKHTEFTHAHHSFPLGFQFECGVEEPIHDHQWLCPTHHKRVHMLLSGYLTGTRELDFLDHVHDDDAPEWLKIEKVAQPGIDLCCEHLGRSPSGREGRFDPPWGVFIACNHREMQPTGGPK